MVKSGVTGEEPPGPQCGVCCGQSAAVAAVGPSATQEPPGGGGAHPGGRQQADRPGSWLWALCVTLTWESRGQTYTIRNERRGITTNPAENRGPWETTTHRQTGKPRKNRQIPRNTQPSATGLRGHGSPDRPPRGRGPSH